MASRQKPDQPGKRTRVRPKKSQGEDSTAKVAKKKTTKQKKIQQLAIQEGTVTAAATSEDQGESSVTSKKRTRKF